MKLGWLLAAALPFIAALLFATLGCSACPAPQAEYALAVQGVCGELDDVECEAQRTDEMAAVREQYRPKFEESAKCRLK